MSNSSKMVTTWSTWCHGLEEMRHLLMCATLELDSARAVASAEVELHDAQVRHLQELLAAAQRERDEAREQYLDQQVMRSSLMEQQQQQQVQHQQGDMSLQLQQSPWRQSLSSGPSPAAGFSPAAAAVLSSSAVVSPQLLPSCLPAPPAALFQTAAGPPVMLSSLPEKGKLMQAVMDAGPLLQTLLMASSSPQLPQWRHPPPGLESLQLPITNSSCATDPNMSTTTLQGGNKYGVHRQLQRLSSFSSSYPISNNNSSSSSSSMSSPISKEERVALK
ncbi:unnamed protein product [Sphagnum compactum]